MGKQSKLEVQWVALARLRPYRDNPRRTMPAVAGVAKSIQEYGWRQPIVVTEDYEIIAGHVRYEAARQLKLKKVPVHVAKDLTPAQVHAYRVADNITGERSEWITGALIQEVRQAETDGEDMSWLGISTQRLGAMRRADRAKAPGASPVAEAQCRHGELYRLGNHLLYCGDSTELPCDPRINMKAPVCVTDPPYDMPAEQQVRGILSTGAEAALVLGQYRNLCGVVHQMGMAIAWDAVLIYTIPRITTDRAPVSRHGRGILFGDAQAGEHDDIICFAKKGCGEFSRRRMANAIGGQSSVIEVYRTTQKGAHPHEKPAWLWRGFYEGFSADTFWEPFAGSGSCYLAAEECGKTIIGAEIEPHWCDAIIARWETSGGAKAEKHE